MGDLPEKKKINRYPMGNPKQAKTTLSRLTRDLLNKRIDINSYRAACYGLSVLCSLLKFETPEKTNITIGKPDFLMMDSQERKNEITKLLKKAVPFYEDYLEYANKKADDINSEKIKPQELESFEKSVELENMLAEISEGSTDDHVEKLFIAAVRAERTEKTEQKTEPPVSWKKSGIGVKRG